MNGKIELTKGDITKTHADAIVNAANPSLLGGGGVDGAIHRAAGPLLREECTKLGGCKTGEAKITKGYDLAAKFVIHTVGPVWRDGNQGEATLLKNCYFNCLKLAEEYGMETIAFPAISTGAYGYPKKQAAEIAVGTVREYLKNSKLKRVIFVLFGEENFAIYRDLISSS